MLGWGNGRDVNEIKNKSLKIRSIRVKNIDEIPKKIIYNDINESIDEMIKTRDVNNNDYNDSKD